MMDHENITLATTVAIAAGALLLLRSIIQSVLSKKSDIDTNNSNSTENSCLGLPPEGPTFQEFFPPRAENQIPMVAKYGNIFTIKSPLPGIVPDQVFINDPKVVKELTIKRANMYRDPSSFTTRGDVFAKATQYVVGVGVTGLKGDEWQWRKRALLKEFHKSKLLNNKRGLIEALVKEGTLLCDALDNAAAKKDPVPVDLLTTEAAVGVILYFLFGRQFTFDVKKVRSSAKDLMECLMARLTIPAFVYDIVKYIPGTQTYKVDCKRREAWAVIDGIVGKEIDLLIDECEGKVSVHPDRKPGSVIASLLENETRFRSGGKSAIIAEARVFIQAGFETTAHSLAFSMGMMAERPDLLDAMARQGREILCASDGNGNGNGNGNANDDFSVSMIETALKQDKLRLFHNFFMEAIRLYPLAPGLGGECTSDLTIVDSETSQIYKLPRGTGTFFPNIPLQRHVPDPDSIMPDRWNVRKPEDQPFLHTFQNGPHTCPGKPLSLLEGQVFLLMVATKFDFAFPDGIKKVEYDDNMLLRPKNGMPLLVKRRQVKAS